MPDPFNLPKKVTPLNADVTKTPDKPTTVVGQDLTLDQLTELLKKAGKLPDSLKQPKKQKKKDKKEPIEEIRLQPYPNAARFLGTHPYLSELDEWDRKRLETMREKDLEDAPNILGVINFYTREGRSFNSGVKDIKAEYEYRGDGFIYYVHDHQYAQPCNLSCRRLDKNMKPMRYED